MTAALWVVTDHSARLSGRRNRDTAPEVALRRELHRLGRRFRLQRRVAGRVTADIVLPGSRVAVFVDGCFWHGCPHHYRPPAGPNAQAWKDKITGNRARDVRATKAASEAGWMVVRVWECQIKDDVAAVARLIP